MIVENMKGMMLLNSAVAERTSSRWFNLLVSVALFVLATGVALAATRSGPGINPDSVNYLNMGANVVEGNGFAVDITRISDADVRSPIVFWPPGYGLAIAGFVWLGVDVVQAARLATTLSYALLVVLVFVFGTAVHTRLVGVVGAFALIMMMAPVRAASFALSEVTFALLVTTAVYFLIRHLQSPQTYRWLLLAAFFMGAGVLTRYLGIVWVGAAWLVLAVAGIWQRRPMRRLLAELLLFGGIPVALIVPWLLRNRFLTGYLTGFDRSIGFRLSFWQNLQLFFQTIRQDFFSPLSLGLPAFLQNNLILLVMVAAFVGLMLLAVFQNRRGGSALPRSRRQLFAASQMAYIGIYLVIVGVYFAALLVLSSVQQMPPYDWPRLLVPAYPLLILAGVAGSGLLLNRFVRRWWLVDTAVIGSVVAIIFLLPHLYITRGYVAAAATGQQFSDISWQQNSGLAYLNSTITEDDILYSDKPQVVHLYLQHPVKYVPYLAESEMFDQYLTNLTAEANPAQRHLVVFFTGPNGEQDPYFEPRYSLTDFEALAAQRADVVQVQVLEDAVIFQLGLQDQ